MSWKNKLLDPRYVMAYVFPLLFFMGFIFYMSSVPSDSMGGISLFSIDKVYHIVEYFILSFLFLRLTLHHKVEHPYLYAIMFAFIFGVTDEFHQLLVPGRVFSVLDMIANGIGSCVILAFRKWR